MLYLIFTVDGDWNEYFDVNLPEDKRAPRVEVMQGLIKQEIEVAARNLNGRFIHFIHASPRARTFFLNEPFIKTWKQIVENGGNIGLHCHEDDPHKAYYFQDSSRMKSVIYEQVSALRRHGLNVCAYRAGYLAFSSKLIPILEENGLHFDFSCAPGKYLIHGNIVVSDWRGAPTSLYRMSYHDYRKSGNSGVYEIPIGVSKGHFLHFEKSGPQTIKEVASDLRKKSMRDSCDIVVSVLVHSYDYTSQDAIKNIEEKISLLKKYGRFINLKELQDFVEGLPK